MRESIESRVKAVVARHFNLPPSRLRLDASFIDDLGGDPDDPELAEELLALVPELFDEGVVGRPSPERLARVAVDVRDHQFDLLLRERIEGRAFLQDPPELQVEALDVRLLAVGVAVEHADAAGLPRITATTDCPFLTDGDSTAFILATVSSSGRTPEREARSVPS